MSGSARVRGVDRVLLCSGRAYYALAEERAERGDTSTAIIRLEQLYPLPEAELAEALAPYPDAELVFVQDEAANQGIWPWLALHMPTSITGSGRLRLVSPPEAASPAVGGVGVYRAQQAALMAAAFERS